MNHLPFRSPLLVIILSTLTAISACSPVIWAEETSSDEITIVAFGDSTTATRGKLKVYASLLANELPKHGVPVRMINAGVPGDHTDRARTRFDKDVLSQNPDIVLIQFGINDAAVDVWKDPPATDSRVAIGNYVDNLRYFVRTLRSQNTRVVLMTSNPLRWTAKMRQMYGKSPYLPDDSDGFDVVLKTYVGRVRQLAKSEQVPLVDVYQIFETFGKQEGQSVDDLLIDGIHPNDRGHRIVADLLIAELVNTPDASIKKTNGIDVRVNHNPPASCLDEPEQDSSLTRVRFEDYVSNPPPGVRDPMQGWIAHFATPFTGLVEPQAADTTRSPLPAPIGMLVESDSGTVGFFDPSSSVDVADPRADRLVFRFVDPADQRRAATVSRVAFRVVGSSVKLGKVRFSLHDIEGNRLSSGVLQLGSPSHHVASEIDCVAVLDGQPASVIHKVVVEHSGGGYFVVGNVWQPSQADFAFDGFTISKEVVRRSIGEQIPRPHFEQWQQFREAQRITDMTRCTPAGALSDRREQDKWKVFEYETANFSGKCVSVGRDSTAPDLTLKLGKQGWHAVYVGLSAVTIHDRDGPQENKLEVKLKNDTAFTRLSNRLDVASPRREELEEVFLGVADLSGNDLQFSTVYQQPARIHYVKTIALTDSEVAAVLADRRQRETKNLVATFDGYTWIHPFRPQDRAALAATFSAYRDSDFKTWWFQLGGADLVHHPSEIGSLMGGHLDTFPRAVDREFTESVRNLHSQGIDPLRVAVEEAHAQEAEILVCLRAGAWKAAPPWEEFFQSKFYEDHPEWRCVDHDGTPTMYMSYAVEEVQDHLINVYREALQRGADGVGFLFHRGMPMILWEQPFCDQFQESHGVDPRELDEHDPRVAALRAKIVIRFIRKVRRMLEEVREERGEQTPRLKFAVSTFASAADNEKFGLDVERWISEGLIDQIGIAWFAYHTSGLKTKNENTAYYARITDGSDVKIYPFFVGWKMNSAVQLLKESARLYDQGADGFAVWDPNQFERWQSGNNPFWPLVSRLGHREKIRDGSLLYAPVRIPLTRLGQNHYSRWFPNTGF